MTNLLINACTVASLASAALAGRTSQVAGATPSGAPAPAGQIRCPAHGNVTAWKTFNGDQAPGLGAAFAPRNTKANASVPGYICITSKCTPQSLVPPSDAQSPANYLEADPGYGPLSVDNDLQNFAALQNLAATGNAADACFGYHLTRSFAGQPVFEAIGTNTDVSLATNAAFLQGFWSKIPNLTESLQQFPAQVPVYYDFITAYRGHCSNVLGNYIGSSERV